MPSVQHQGAVTLPVTHLPSATSFYLSALQPLGYRFITKVQHDTSSSSSDAVGLGPEGTRRVDFFLSQSRRNSRQGSPGKPAHIVFPAYSRIDVRDFYAAALDAGGNAISSPERRSASDNLFSAVVTDLDGNKLEVCYCDDVPRASNGNPRYPSSVKRSSKNQYSNIDQIRRDVADGTIGSPVIERDLPGKKVVYTVEKSRPRATRRYSTGGNNRPAQTSTVEVTGNKTVVGTLLGAAAGAAVAYALSTEEKDSRRREETFAARMDARDRVKAEARENTMKSEQSAGVTTRSDKPPASRDRDSGYFSGGSQRRDDQPGGGAPQYRTITYPQTAQSSRRRSTSLAGERQIAARGPPQKSATVPARSNSFKQAKNTYYYPPSRPGTAPDSAPRSRGQRSPPPASFPRGSSTKGPPSRTSKRDSPAPSRTSRRTASPSACTPRQSDYDNSAKDAPPRSSRGPPPQQQEEAADSGESDGNEYDDLETVVPDDSISVAPTEERTGRRKSSASASKGSRRSGGRRSVAVG